MELVDYQILDAIHKKLISVEPFDEKLINPNSLDIRLGYHFIRCIKTNNVMNPKTDKQNGEVIQLSKPSDYIIIRPGDFILATTLETIHLTDCIRAQLEGKSSLARWGLVLHQTGGWIDAGFHGEITLELSLVYPDPIKLFPEMTIGQLAFNKTESCKVPYNVKKTSKYNGQKGATCSMYYKN
ncbi:MAG TPA: dCTP deaminase [Methanospirillum sp.]|uniref:dCTP deaminase n=1 Tax=Methanospirillum sp. TaxID=45200 RepID=UPI002C3ABCFD|nr:dCTP deaminase [Methanospirillum sp.]HOJ97601.1 dCTP deaminase [Methanospirillum sp.]HPP76872.1 dCTP deaminase [Methanospirillum sp.]